MTRRLSVKAKVSTLAIAVALVAGPSPAAAQFVGTINSSNGIDTVNSTNSNLIITGQQAVINWTATDTPTSGVIAFLPEGNSATFNGSSNFAVLNRVTPGTAGNAIFMGGNITSLIGGEIIGGTVFFYSPNGIIIGQNAAINVGSLGLTTLPIADDGQGNWMTGFGTSDPQVTFGQATDPNSFIRTVAAIDGSINAWGAGSYVAMVAPRIEHGGVIRTDTAAALVAAEAATITFSPDGLFDVQVDVGTDDANGVDVDGGTIERRNQTEGLTNHYAYLVAVAKNDAVTMLVRNGGSIGFDTATSAAVEDNVVVLSGGRDIEDGQIGTAAGAAPVNLNIDSSTFTTDVEADVSGGADIRTSTGNTSFGLDPTSTSLDLTAGDDSIIAATNGNTLAIAGSLNVDLDVFGTSATTTGNVFRLTTISASTLTVGGNVFIAANTFGAGGEDANGGDATGGTAIVQTSAGGTIDIAGDLNINVDGWGGNAVGFQLSGGNGTGGIAHILANGGSGSNLTVGGEVNVSASGVGGTIGDDCFSCQITGGNGNGGTIMLQALVGTGNQLNLDGKVNLIARGDGGPGDAAGGNGLGGTVQFVSGDAGSITIAGNLLADAGADGGFGMDNDVIGGQGGSATGGNISTIFSGAASTIDLLGTSTFAANAFGGDGVLGGNGTGGFVNLQAGSNGTLTTGFLGASANGSGGSGFTGGSGTGGRAWVQATTGGDIVADSLSIAALGFGGSGEVTRAGDTGAVGGTGTGGHAIASANGAGSTLTVTNTLDLEAGGRGGFDSTGTSLGGNGQGGEAEILADNSGTVTLNGFASADATGHGGSYSSDDSTGGNGTGGTILFRASNGATLHALNEVQLDADGIGGFIVGECDPCGGTGGDGTGGTVTIQASGGAATQLTVDGEVNANAVGFGSDGFNGPGGDGQGGIVRLAVQTGAIASFQSSLFLNASGNGGWQTAGGVAGNGTGGLVDAFVGATGGTLTVGGTTELVASGFGGQVEGIGGTGGNGQGGTAQFMALGGTATFNGLFVDGTGDGGEAESGTGGNGTGNVARIQAEGGDITVDGTAFVNASGFGGSGSVGGDGTGGGNFFSFTGGAHIVAANGDIVINGSAASFADGFGGSGADGGNGGDGTGGWASIHAANANAGPSSITVQGVESSGVASASGFGGHGGDGLAGTDGQGGNTGTSGTAGGNGGNGGTGTGGVAAITASAGNGTVNIAFGSIAATGTGGFGGHGGNGGIGGNGDGGAGGNGGAGGIGGAGGAAVGGFATFGVETGENDLAPGINNGTGNFAFVDVDASAVGGNGGDGGSGGVAGTGSPDGVAGADGNGGAGGNAEGGTAMLEVRGGRVDVTFVQLTANATGGDGGIGAIDGAGGNAESDEVVVAVTNRAGNTALRGRLNAGTITGEVISTGGFGSTFGASMMEGGSGFFVINGNARIDSFDFNIVADGQIPDLATDMIELINADVRVANDFSFNTSGVTSVYADNSTLNAGTFTVAASNFIHDPERSFPALVGTISADTFNLTTGQDLIIDAHLVSTGPLALNAPGLIDIENATSTTGEVIAGAGATFDAGNLTAASFVSVAAVGAIDVNLVNAGTNITLLSFEDTINANAMAAGGFIEMESALGTTTGDLAADLEVRSFSSGPITHGTIGAGSFVDIRSFGGSIATGDVTAGGSVEMSAGPLIDVGNIMAGGFIALNADSILGGDMNAGGFIDITAGAGNISLLNLTAGTTIDLDSAGNISFGNVIADDFDFSAGGNVFGGDIIAATQASGEADGTIVLGDINVGILQTGGAAEDGFAVGFSSATSIQVGDVDADEAIGFATLGNLNAGNLNAGTDVMTLVGGDTAIASITTPGGGRVYHGDAQMFLDAGGPDDFDPSLVFAQAPVRSGGGYNVAGAISTGQLQVGAASISTGAIAANNGVTLDSASSVATGAIDAGLLEITAGTDISTGDIFAFGGVTMNAGGSILSGDITGGFIDLLAGDDITTGDLTTQILLQDGIGTQFLFPGASITLEAGGDISTGAISSIDGVHIQAGGSISTGLIDAIDFVEAHGIGGVTTDDIDAGDYILLTSDTGAIAIGDAAAGTAFQAVAGTNLTAGAVSADSIDATAGGTAAINGAWSAGDVQVTSNDINITANGSISAGDISLVSTNATQTVVGDGVTGGGYQLADAEYDRLSANDITVIADPGLGAEPLMLIGDLSVDGSDGEAIHDYEFITGDSESESAQGSIRILGDMVFSNMGTAQSVGFTTGTFELDAATGLLSLENAPGVLGGELFLNAARIHVASGEVLDQLAEDPQYDGYQEDLNAPAVVQRPDGVIRAASIDIEFGDAGEGELNTLYVQNTGTEELPAGFVISGQSLFGEGNEVTPPPGSINLIINGQIVTQAGTLTGIDVRDALVEAEGDITPFTENSTINGCLLVGPCEAIEPEPPFPPGFTPTPGIQDEVTLIDDGKLPPPLFGNEDFIDDNLQTTADGANSPIEPPVPLFDTSALGDQGDIDDPVSGSGNPALMETPTAACPADGSQPAGQCKQEKQP